jgi:cytochrome c553
MGRSTMAGVLLVLGVAATSATILVGGGCAGAQAPTPVESGRQVFLKNGCHGCHTIGAMGTPIGPDLTKMGARHDAAYLQRWLRDPAAQRPRAHMPQLELTEQDIQTLAAYLASLK